MEGFVQKVSAPRGKRRNKPPVCGGRTAPPKEGKDNPPLREKLKRQREKPNKICKTVAVPLPRKTTLSKLETLNSAIPWLQTHRLPGMSAAPRFGTNTINTLFGKPDFRRRRRFATSPNISIAHVKKTGDPQKKENPFQSRNQALKTPQTSKSSSKPPPAPKKNAAFYPHSYVFLTETAHGNTLPRRRTGETATNSPTPPLHTRARAENAISYRAKNSGIVSPQFMCFWRKECFWGNKVLALYIAALCRRIAEPLKLRCSGGGLLAGSWIFAGRFLNSKPADASAGAAGNFRFGAPLACRNFCLPSGGFSCSLARNAVVPSSATFCGRNKCFEGK